MEQVEQFKYLAVIFKANLSWKVHVNSVIRTIMSTNQIDCIDHIILGCPEFSDLRVELTFLLLKQDFLSRS